MLRPRAGDDPQNSETRRRFLKGMGLGGLVLTIGPAMIPAAELLPGVYGQAAAAKKLTDEQIAAFLESLELAAVAAYQQAAAKISTPAAAAAAVASAGHHRQHAPAVAAVSKGEATGKANPKLLDTVSGQLRDAPDEKAVLHVLYDLENAFASTYLYALGLLTGKGALQLSASILPVESQHAVVLGQALGLPLFEATAGSSDPYAGTGYVPTFVTQDQKIDPAVYPAAAKG